MATFVGPRRTRRTTKRLARLRVANADALPRVAADNQYTQREARKVRRAAKRLDTREKLTRAERPKARRPYDPLAPLTGGRLRRESRAAERMEFGPRERELREAIGRQEQTAANTSTYYDDWRQALRESTARVNEANRINVEATEARIDRAYSEDKAGVAQRDAAASEQAAKLGRGPMQSAEGAQAVEAARSQGNQAAARLRGRAVDDTRFFESRGATAALGKAQAMGREAGKRERLRGEERDLAGDRGAFRVDFRRKSRQDEREWAAIQQEFGLKTKESNRRARQDRQDRQLERQKLATQKIVARIYSAGDRAGARAQVRVAELQLRKGRITKNQMKTIRNIYEGLPGGAPIGGGKGSQPTGTAKPKLQNWEQDKVENAVHILSKQNAKPKDRNTWIKRMMDEGVPARLARMAWRRYIEQSNAATNRSPGSDRAQP